MKNEKKGKHPEAAPGVRSPHAILAPALRNSKHGLYRDLVKLDGRTRLSLIKGGLKKALLERFPDPIPAVAHILAERCAIKLIRVASYEGYILAGQENPAINADRDYLALTASIRADIQTLYLMAKEGPPEKAAPSLAEYLSAIRSGQLVPVEASPEPECVDKPLTSDSKRQD